MCTWKTITVWRYQCQGPRPIAGVCRTADACSGSRTATWPCPHGGHCTEGIHSFFVLRQFWLVMPNFLILLLSALGLIPGTGRSFWTQGVSLRAAGSTPFHAPTRARCLDSGVWVRPSRECSSNEADHSSSSRITARSMVCWPVGRMLPASRSPESGSAPPAKNPDMPMFSEVVDFSSSFRASAPNIWVDLSARQMHRQHADPIVEVLPGATVLRSTPADPFGGGEEPHIHLDGLVAAIPQRPCPPGPQQFSNEFQRISPISSRRWCRRRPLETAMRCLSPGAGPAFMSEQFGYSRVFPECGAVDLDKRLSRRGRIVMHRAGKKALAGPGGPVMSRWRRGGNFFRL